MTSIRTSVSIIQTPRLESSLKLKQLLLVITQVSQSPSCQRVSSFPSIPVSTTGQMPETHLVRQPDSQGDLATLVQSIEQEATNSQQQTH